MPEGERSMKNLEREVDSSHLMQVGMLSSRYEVYGEIAAGGMASVQYGRLLGPRGFSRAVAIKRLHAHYSREAEFVSMFLDEARLSARLMHANIIHTLDVIETPGEVALVMEYVHGETLWTLLRLVRGQGQHIPVRIGCSLITSVLHGLHAAHEARDDLGDALHIVHRDVSPQNILIGADGIPRILDFGIAKALGRLRTTPSGEIKGKLGYIALEQLHAANVDRRTDVYGAAAVLWELLTGAALFDGPSEPAIVHRVLYETVQPPSRYRSEVPVGLDGIVLRALSRDADARYATAQEMALALEHEIGLASQSEVASWLAQLAGTRLNERSQLLAALQNGSSSQRLGVSGGFSDTRKIDVARNTSSTRADKTRARKRLKVVPMLVLAALSFVAALMASNHWYGRVGPAHAAHAPLPVPVPTPPVTLVDHAAPPLTAAGVAHDPSVDTSVQKIAVSDKSKTARPINKRSVRESVQAPTPAPPLAPSHETTRSKRSADKHCAIFYEIDADGIRQPKPECL